jgi:1-acyl-sn-glycerol-3-phosphate acyltransferase
MLKAFSKFILRLFGWRVKGGLPAGIKKCVVIEAPHTSNWDFVIGRMAFWYFGIKVRFLIKKEMFKPLLGPFLKSMGGIPVDRSRNSGMVGQVAALFEKYDTLFVVITPEGTRKLVPKWKKGFYFIASKAKVPIALGYLDYKLKEGGIGRVIYPTGNFEKDFPEIEDFYREKHPKYPEKFNLSPENPAQ